MLITTLVHRLIKKGLSPLGLLNESSFSKDTLVTQRKDTLSLPIKVIPTNITFDYTRSDMLNLPIQGITFHSRNISQYVIIFHKCIIENKDYIISQFSL